MNRDADPLAAEPLEKLALGALAGLCGLLLLLEVAAGVSGWAFGGGWVWSSFTSMPATLMRLTHHLDEPRRAWPPSVRRMMPDALAFYISLGAVFVATAGLALALLRAVAGPGRPGARWARSSQLRALKVVAAQPGRVTLGKHGRRLLAAEARQSLLVIAPTQSGKTTALAVPAILEWQGPVLAVSVKTDLLRDSISHRTTLGDVAIFDPTGATGLEESASWSPLAGCRDWSGARRVARWMADGASPGHRGLADGDFWYAAAAKLLAPMLFAAAWSGLTMEEVVAWLDTQEELPILQALEAAGCRPALHAMQASLARDERQRSSIYTTAETVLEAYADPGVLAHSALPEIRPDWLLDGGRHTLYVCASARDQKRLRPVFVALIEEILEAAYGAASRRGAPLDPPLLLVLDEVANIAPLPDLDALVATGAGHGVQLVTVLQDLAQAQDRWGREKAETILNNHRAKLLGAGLADERALEWLARLLGEEEVNQQSKTTDSTGRRSVTDNLTRRSLAPANVVREASTGSALLVYGNLPATWLKLRPWYADRHLRSLARRLQSSPGSDALEARHPSSRS